MTTQKTAPSCPRCGAAAPLPIAYGEPTAETFEAAKRGELALGGCVVTENDPAWWCRACEHEYGKTKRGE